jgi:hypothetical protein
LAVNQKNSKVRRSMSSNSGGSGVRAASAGGRLLERRVESGSIDSS